MWKVLVILNLGVLHCAVSTFPPSPTSVFITSVNLRNVLEWSPGNHTPGNATFTVQYAIYGEGHWRPVRRCTEIVQSWCDLSSETGDLEEGYYAQVCAVSRNASGCVRTQRFDPKLDTSFGPPLMTIEVENNIALVTVKGPMRYQPSHQMPVVSMATIYRQMMYNLSINNTYRKKTSHFTLLSGQYKHHLTEYNTEYCFSAQAKFLAMPVRCQSSEWQCITTPPDPVVSQLKWVVVGIVVPLLCVCLMVVIGYILYQYLMGIGQKTPYMLDRAFLNQRSLTFPPETTKMNGITAISPADTTPGQHLEDPPPQYPGEVCLPQEPGYNCDDPLIYSCIATSNDCSVSGEGGNYLKQQTNLSAGVYAPQAMSSSWPRSFHTQLQTHTAAAEWSAPEQTALLRSPLNVKGEMLKEDGMAAPGVGEKSQNELEPLLSVCTAQNNKYATAAHSEQSESRLADDCSAMGLEETEKDGGGEEEEEQATGAIFIDWDPKSGKLVLPELEKWNHRGNEPTNGGEEEEYEMGGELSLGGVFVRQACDEEVLASAELEREGGEEEMHDVLTKWNLVIPMDD